jgi:two-component system response regulator AtoC
VEQIDDLPPMPVIFGKTEAMRTLADRLPRIAQSPVPVLILGESGTGKEVVARLMHNASKRRTADFVKVCCPAIPVSLLESELFGYEKGAFTGAYRTKRGRVEQADNGTLFLDEIGDLDASLQVKLLQLLQDGVFMRVGGQGEQKVDIRLLSASNQDLRNHSGAGHFRLDLFYRINAFTVELPPLRKRIADLPVLISYFLDNYASKFGVPVKPLSRDALRIMENYEWPGNIRELENVIRSYVVMGTEDAIESELLSVSSHWLSPEVQFEPNVSLKEITKTAVHGLERQIILKALRNNDWNRKNTAKSLKISYRSLLYKMRDAGFTTVGAEANRELVRETCGPAELNDEVAGSR